MTESTPAPYRSVDPTNGAELAAYDAVTDEQLEAALAASHYAYAAWSVRPIGERAEIVGRVARGFEKRADELAALAVREMGKPLAEALEEIDFCVSIFDYYAEHGPRFAADQPIKASEPGAHAVMQKRPIGPLLGVMPWNFPFYQVARFAAPNLVLGNTVLLKHAESVPGCAEAIQDLMDAAGVPTGAYRNVFATHGQVERVIGDRRVQGVSLTGSERAGAAVAEIAGCHLKKCVLELGGSDPYIVLDAPNVAEAAALAWQTRVYNTGQACNSNKRIIVMDDFFEPFVAEMARLAREMTPGDPMDLAEGSYAPMSSRAAALRVADLVDDAVTKGATLHAGGELSTAPTAYFSPAVLTGVTPQMRAFREEVFGPVAVVHAAASDQAALELANDCDYGLGGAVFSSDPERAHRVASRLEVGMANVNTTAGEGAEVPFGGVKRSGFGRELGPMGMDEFANKRLLYVARRTADGVSP